MQQGICGRYTSTDKEERELQLEQSCSDRLHQQLSRSGEGGLWRRVFHELLTDRNNRYLMIYSTIVQAHTIKRPPVAKGARTRLPGIPEEV